MTIQGIYISEELLTPMGPIYEDYNGGIGWDSRYGDRPEDIEEFLAEEENNLMFA